MAQTKDRVSTREKLVLAAAAEFREHGFAGTDSNRIARRAGFAPQTFYRWFKDKTAIFLAVYRLWEEEERAMMSALLSEGAGALEQVEAAVMHHRNHRLFRRSLRQLSQTDPDVRAARAESRLRQLDRIGGDRAPNAVRLLLLERLAEALAEGEMEDMGLGEAEARAAMAGILAAVRRR